MKVTGYLFLVFLLCSALGCAHNKKAAKAKSNTQGNSEALRSQKASAYLDQMVKDAKSSGKKAQVFFGNELYLKASAASMEGDHATANIIFDALLKLEPKDNFLRKKYAVSLIRSGDLEKSKQLLQGIFADSKEKDSHIGLILAGIYTTMNKSDEAIKIYYKLLAKNPKNVDACVFLGKTYIMGKKFKKAVSTLKKCDQRFKKKGIFNYYIGKFYADKNDLKNAQKFFKKSVAKQSDLSQAVVALGLTYEEQKKDSAAIKVYKKYLKENDQDQMVLNRLVQLYFAKDNLAEVIPYAEKLSDLEPENLNLKVKLGIIYTDAKKYSEALVTFKELLAQVPENDKILYYIGAIYQEVKKFEEAVSYYQKIPMDSGLFQDTSIQIAQMLSDLALREFQKNKSAGERAKEFTEFIDRRVEQVPNFAVQFQVLKASFFENTRQNKKAITSLESVLKQTTFTDRHKYYLASLYEKEQEYSKSTNIVMDILEKNPKNADAWNFLGYSLLERGERMDLAYQYIQKALAISPHDGFIRDSLGWYYFKKGENQKALREIQYAAKVSSNDYAIQKHLAVIYSNLQKFDKAKFWVKKALENVSEENEVAELQNVLKQLESKRIPASFKPSK